MSLWEDLFGKSSVRDFMPPTYQCQQCGAVLYVGQQHYCGSYPRGEGAKVPTPLTEDDVRRIVREELAAVGKSDGRS